MVKALIENYISLQRLVKMHIQLNPLGFLTLDGKTTNGDDFKRIFDGGIVKSA